MQGEKVGPYKVTPRKLEIAAGILQKGGYRSDKAYLSVIKARYIINGAGGHTSWTAQ